MISVKQDFSDRRSEIEEYFAHLRLVVEDMSIVEVPVNGGDGPQRVPIPEKTKKVLVASTFLLLYNLVESTIRNVLEFVYEEYEKQGLTYSSAVDEVRRLYVDQCSKPLKEGAFKAQTLATTMLDYGNFILSNSTLTLRHDSNGFGGNLDAEKIRSLASRHGIMVPSVKGDSLLTIKTKRNNLAHGDFSFSFVGRDYTVKDLEDISAEAYRFIEDFIVKVEVYLNSRSYQVGHLRANSV